MKTAIVVPARNEARKIYNVSSNLIDRGYSVVVVDDGSQDDTASEARRAGAKVLRHFINRGYGAALETGNQWALQKGYDVVVHFDGDGQHNPDEIKNLVNPVARGKVDVVIGSRFLRSGAHVPVVRGILIKLAVLFTRVFSGLKLTDAHNGFRALNRRALESLDCRQDGMSYASEIIDQVAENRLRIGEFPVTIRYTDYSKSKGEGNIKKIMVGLKFLWGKLVR